MDRSRLLNWSWTGQETVPSCHFAVLLTKRESPNMKNQADAQGALKEPIGHFRQVAHKYDYYRTLDEAPIHFLVETFPEHGTSICEIGSGTGRYLIPLVQGYQKRGTKVVHAYGVDTSASMLDEARQASESSGIEIECIEGTSNQTGIPSHSVTLVTTFNAFHHFPVRETMAEMERIVKPGAVIGIYIRTRQQEQNHVCRDNLNQHHK